MDANEVKQEEMEEDEEEEEQSMEVIMLPYYELVVSCWLIIMLMGIYNIVVVSHNYNEYFHSLTTRRRSEWGRGEKESSHRAEKYENNIQFIDGRCVFVNQK